MFKYTKTTLQKIENIFGELDYKVRYERGSFNSGYCLVENKNIEYIENRCTKMEYQKLFLNINPAFPVLQD